MDDLKVAETVTLCDGGVDNVGVLDLVLNLRVNSHLRTLDVSNCALSSRSLVNVCEILLRTPALTALSIGRNAFDMDSFRAVCTLVSSSPSLSSLALAPADVQSPDLLGDVCARSSAMTALSIGAPLDLSALKTSSWAANVTAGMTPIAATVASYCLPFNANLTMIDMSAASVGDAGLRALTAALSRAPPPIEVFNVPSNSISDAAVLSRAISALASLRVVDFSHNPLGNAGFLTLLPSIRLRGGGLISLGAASVGAGREGVEALAVALKGMTSLFSLSLSHNLFGSIGARAIAAAITPPPPSLRQVALRGCDISDGGWRDLSQALARCCDLSFDVAENRIKAPPPITHPPCLSASTPPLTDEASLRPSTTTSRPSRATATPSPPARRGRRETTR
jgi:hypothetical protein